MAASRCKLDAFSDVFTWDTNKRLTICSKRMGTKICHFIHLQDHRKEPISLVS